jgi:predicted metal-binding protein
MSAPKILNLTANVECECGWIEEVRVAADDIHSSREIVWRCDEGCGRYMGVSFGGFTKYLKGIRG